MTPFRSVNNFFDRLKRLKRPPALQRFMAHNRRVFPRAAGMAQRKPVVLFELGAIRSAHIAYSYLANILAETHQARIETHVARSLSGWWPKLKFKIAQAIGHDVYGAYKSFGTTGFIDAMPSAAQKQRAKEIYDQVLPGIHSTKDVEDLTLNGVWVGDLIYDTYLMTYRRPTIDPTSREFQGCLLESIEFFVFWSDYLDANDVRAINVSHCVYNLAMPLRLAVRRDIPVYQANITHLYRLTSRNLFAYNDFFYFRERFARLPADVQVAGIEEAKKRIKRRFAGEVGVDMSYSTKSAYGAKRHARLIAESPRKKILIATHCFFDSPHSYGNNLFPDFYEWLNFLGRIAEETDYDWYIKTHPDFLPGTKEVIDGIVAKYPKFTLLPADASHHQIISEGINCALTVFGTIAFEYAALGIPVINASLNNPHVAYGFNLHAKDAEDYGRMLTGLESLNLKIDSRSIYEYYFMRYIYNTEDLFFESYDRAVKDLGGYDAQFTPAVYDRWLAEWSPEKHQAVRASLQNFIQSGDFRMDYTHSGREFTIKPPAEAA